MENFLLLIDELDDAVASLRMLWPQIAGFLVALGLFATTVLAFSQWPGISLSMLMITALVRGLVGLRAVPGLRTDP